MDWLLALRTCTSTCTRGIVDHDIHLGNLLLSLDGHLWKKADLGNAAWCMLQPDEHAPTFLSFPRFVLAPLLLLNTIPVNLYLLSTLA